MALKKVGTITADGGAVAGILVLEAWFSFLAGSSLRTSSPPA